MHTRVCIYEKNFQKLISVLLKILWHIIMSGHLMNKNFPPQMHTTTLQINIISNFIKHYRITNIALSFIAYFKCEFIFIVNYLSSPTQQKKTNNNTKPTLTLCTVVVVVDDDLYIFIIINVVGKNSIWLTT